ncbi:MAG: Autotransporter adhesin [Bacillota bacterium]|nr:Autotransporter adhesin [Bacillota bacterium]
MKRFIHRALVSAILIAALVFGSAPGAGFAAVNAYATVSEFNISDVKVTVYEDNFDLITFHSDVAGLTKDCFAITDTANQGLHPMVVSTAYDSGTYTLTVNDLNYIDTYTLTVSKEGYQTYTNSNVFYGTLATAEDLDLVNELNLYDTYSRDYDEATGVLTISNSTYKSNAILYPNSDTKSLYHKINTNNGYNTNGAGDYRVIGAFVKAPSTRDTQDNVIQAKSAKTYKPDEKKMVPIGTDSLIDANPNYQESVADGKNANDNDYWKTIYAYPVYAKNAVKISDGGWCLYDPADRVRVVEWYTSNDCSGTPFKVVRFTVKVEYTGTKSEEAHPGYPAITLNGGAASIDLDEAEQGLAASTEISSFEPWDGGSLKIKRVTTAFANDICDHDTFGILENESFSMDEEDRLIDSASGNAFAKLNESQGELSVSFYDIADDAQVLDVLRNISYRNEKPYGDAKLQIALSDGSATAFAHIFVKSDTIYVDQTAYDTEGDAADGFSLAEALAAAEDGDEILIEDGTYQGQFLVSSAVNIDAAEGSGGAVTLLSPSTAGLKKSEQDFLTANGRWKMPVLELRTAVPGSGTVTVKNITVDGNFQAIPLTDSKDMLGIAIFNTNAVLDSVTVKNIAVQPDENGKYEGYSVNFGVLVEGADNLSDKVNVTIKNSVIETYQKTGIVAWGPKLHAIIRDNMITGVGDKDSCGQNGMQIGSAGLRSATTAEISGNIISNLGFDNDTYFASGIIIRRAGALEIYDNTISGTGNDYRDGAGVSCGISLMEQANPITIRNNTVRNMQYGAAVEAYGQTYLGANTFTDNDFSDTYYAIYDCTGDDDETYDEANNETITVKSSSPAINSLGYIYYKLFDGADSFTDLGDAPALIDAGAGNDRITAGAGDDTLIAGKDNDILAGGGGNDLFLYEASGNGLDTIKDFVKGDIIRVSGAALTTGSVTTGTGLSVNANSVQVGLSENNSTLYIDTDGVTGVPELQILLDGVYDPAYLKLNGTDITYEKDSLISPTTAYFDKRASRQVDLSVVMALNSLSSITNGSSTLTPGTDYTVTGNTITILKEYLAAQNNGTTTLTFRFGTGIAANLTIEVTSTSGGSGGGKNDPVPAPAPTVDLSIQVNGQPQAAGTATTQTNSAGQTVTTVTVDTAKLEKILEQKGNDATVTIPAGGADVISAALTGDMVKSMENRAATLVIKTDSAVYTLPASELNIDEISKELASGTALSDIKVSVQIAEPSGNTAAIVKNAASEGSFDIVVPALEFTISCTSGGRTINANRFNAYVERMVAIPEGIDAAKITTGIVVEPDGKIYHVPTRITVIDGKYYAVINSRTNSVYTVIWHPVEFGDVANHWAKDAINDMGSRMVVTGVGNNNYNPGSNITRAEFSAIIVRALGLAPGLGESSFGDVSEKSWYGAYTGTASSYDLIMGYQDGSFRPNDNITREQAMAIITRATKLTDLDASTTDAEIKELLSKYKDGTSVSGYAREAAAACLKTRIITGKGEERIAPKDYITRAEVAVIVKRMLVESDLI